MGVRGVREETQHLLVYTVNNCQNCHCVLEFHTTTCSLRRLLWRYINLKCTNNCKSNKKRIARKASTQQDFSLRIHSPLPA